MVLGDYFNIEHINAVSHRLGMSGIITLNEALSKLLIDEVYYGVVRSIVARITHKCSGNYMRSCYE